MDANGSILDQFVDVQTFKFNDFTILNDSFANIIAEEQNSAAVFIPRNRYDLVRYSFFDCCPQLLNNPYFFMAKTFSN